MIWWIEKIEWWNGFWFDLQSTLYLWHLFCFDYFRMAHNQAKWFKKILFSNFWKTWSDLHLCERDPIKSVPFICLSLSVCLSVCLWQIFLRICSVDVLNFLHEIILPYILTSDSQVLENCIFFLDNWVNKTNLDKKGNICHFNGGSITFCAFNDAS